MNVKEIRKSKKLSVVKLGELAGLHRRTIEDIEKNDGCTIANAIKLATALEVTLDELCITKIQIMPKRYNTEREGQSTLSNLS